MPWGIARAKSKHPPHSVSENQPERQNPYLLAQIGVSELNLDDDLLSHGETPHYHRRCIVSLLSSGWDQVVPMLYGRQEIRVLTRDLTASLQQIGYGIVFGAL